MSADETGAERLAEALGHEFREPELLETALAHPSFAHEVGAGRGNERLEFLGDAVLDLVIAHLLYETHPEWNEGDLTRTRAGLVNQHSLARCARALDVGRFVKLGRTEKRSGGAEKDSILANCFEAIVGAIYLDGGEAPVRALVSRVFGDSLESRPKRDAKTEFQEWAHARYQLTPRYRTLADSGTDNDEERFTVAVVVADREWATGVGRSKRLAERAAAKGALAQVQRDASRDA